MASLLHAEGRAAEVARELVRRRADLATHARGSLEQHLVGVHDVLQRWGQPERVRLAGLLHSAYSTEAYGHCLFGRGERARVRELVGVAAERLIFAFCACKREALLAARSGESVSIPGRWRDVTVRLDRLERAELMVIHAANLAEQTSLPRGSPARWLAATSRFLAAARADAEVAPPVFDRGTVVMTAAEETSLLKAYRGLLRTSADVEASPVGEPLVLAALLALAARRGEEATSLAERALAAFDAWGVAWDKRLGLARWRQVAELLARDGRARDDELDAAARRAQAVVKGAGGSPPRIWTQLDALGALATAIDDAAAPPLKDETPDGLPPRFARYIAGLRESAERPLLQFYPGLRVEPWHDPRAFAIVADLERHAAAIAAEARSFDAARFQDEAEDIDREGRWGVLFLLEMGRRNEDNLARCPTLKGILERHRTLTTHAGLMYFSCLDPGSRVAPHQGPTSVRLRCHLALDVPAGCGIRVGGVTRTWEEGRCLVFDDSFVHEVWNDSDRRRIVLVLDLWHPDLTEDEVALLAGLHRYGAANGAGAERYWARNDAALRRARTAVPLTSPPETPRALGDLIGAALRAGDLPLAGERAARYAAICRGTRFHPVRRDDDPELPASIPWSPVLRSSTLLHDVEQLEYLQRRGVLGDELTPIIARYDELLDTLRPLDPDAPVPLIGDAKAKVGHVYGRLVHVRATPRVERALGRAWDSVSVEDEYLTSRPQVVVVDDFLSTEAIESLRLFCLESTVWSTNRYDYGRLGAFFRDGFNCPLLIQIAEELRAAFPRVIGARHPVSQIWAYKYATSQPNLNPHADFAAVNVNFWITPDDANLDPETGGLVMYDVEAPADWDFATYNRNGGKIRELLAARGARPTVIPYRCNRAVIFDSDLFHATPKLTFRSGYENRRINVTVLYGERNRR